MAKITLLGDLDQTSPLHKIRSRHDLNMVGTLFESLGLIVIEKIIFMKFLRFLCLFVTKTVFFRLGKIENQPIPFWFQKSTKKCRNFIKIIFLATMDLSFQMTSQTCLDQAWNGFYAMVKFGLNHPKVPCSPFLTILVKIDGTTWDHKF